jgi:hypothetical protein
MKRACLFKCTNLHENKYVQDPCLLGKQGGGHKKTNILQMKIQNPNF